jgi:apolipoprotein N-acyltransferase
LKCQVNQTFTTNFKQEKPFKLNKLQIIAAVIFSGLCWYISNGLNGDFWYLLWLAPVPILIISFNSTPKITFWVAFIAYLIGRLSWFSYLVSVAKLIPAIIFTIALPLIFALIIILSRSSIRKINSWYAVFIFPVFFTAFEWLLINFSPDGTAASIAYSQSNVLQLIQIVSLTGILGITFIITFIPSVLAVGWKYRNDKRKLFPLLLISFSLLISVLLYGFWRINSDSNKNTITAGLVVLEEKTHSIDKVDFQVEIQPQKISDLTQKGAKIVVLPERAININRDIDSIATNILINSAKLNNVSIVVGYTNLKSKKDRNSSLVIDKTGSLLTDYNKTHLVKVLEDRFTPGNQIGLFNIDNFQAGTAICKDLDFPKFIRNYGESNTALLCVPAWDFIVDDWLHSRMAILRGVENGFSIIRTARQGRLTISDSYGKVVTEVNCSNGKETTLLGQVSLTRTKTFYTQYGEWFGLIIIFASILFIILTFIRKNNNE